MDVDRIELTDMLTRWNTGQTITNEEIDILVNNGLLYDDYTITELGNDTLYGKDRLDGENNCQFD